MARERANADGDDGWFAREHVLREPGDHVLGLVAGHARGIITPRRVIKAIAQGYARLTPAPLLPPVADLGLTREMFFPTAAHPCAALEELRASVRYGRETESGRQRFTFGKARV